ncbi:MAG: TIGR00730 family Rossman fold protein [Trebonia sp.]
MCGTRAGHMRQDADAARELGRGLAKLTLSVFCSGGGTGLMGALADGALAEGGRVYGVMPRALLEYGIERRGLRQFRAVSGLAEQQALMLERSDAFIALPGGLGTMYELLAMIANGQRGLHNKPILLLNAGGYFDPLLNMLQQTVRHTYATWDDLRLVHAFDKVAHLVAAIADWRDNVPGSPLVCSVAANGLRAAEVEALAGRLAAAPAGSGRPDRQIPAWSPRGTPPTDRPRWPRDGRDGEKRSTRLHLVYGPTGSGKTGRATALARRTGAPVIVLDRIQCHPALAVGGGRPGEAEIAGTRRIYLCDRPVTAGELPPAEACRLLAAHVDELAANAPMVILEGGSVSVLKLMGRKPEWGSFTWSVDRRPLVPAEQYLPGSVKRARDMLQPPDGGAGLLEELAAAWAHPSARATLMSVFTYRVAVHAAQRAGLVVERATDLGDAARGELAQTLAVALHAHARWQDREIPEPPAAWPRTAAPATDQPPTSGAQLL